MTLNYYEAEWLTKLKLQEAIGKTRKDNNPFHTRRNQPVKGLDKAVVAPVLRDTGSPC